MASDLIWQSSSAPTHGAIGDINTMRISPDYLGMGQDVIIDTNGVLRNRGSFTQITSDSLVNFGINGAAQGSTGTILCLNDSVSAGNFLYGTTAQALTGFAKLTVSSQDNTAPANSIGTNQALYYYSMERLPLDIGQVISTQKVFFDNSGCQTFLWGGNAVTTSDTVTGTAASTIGSTAIAGVGTSWTTALNNCYLFIGAGAAAVYVGQVKSVTSTTTIVLYKGALRTVAAAAPAFKTARPPMYMVYKGRLTTNTASTIVVGSNTKFLNSSPSTGAGAPVAGGNVFRNSDGAYIGTVSTIQNDTTLTLGANAALALVNEEYYICNPNTITVNVIPPSGFSSFACCYFANRYWYGGILAGDGVTGAGSSYTFVGGVAPLTNTNSIAFSKKDSPELLDLDPAAGDIITLPMGDRPDSIRAMLATRAGMLVFRNFDTQLVTGYSPETFRVIKLADDGCLNSLSAKHYGEGIVWAGIKSIWFFDGTRVFDLLKDNVKRFYQRTNKGNQNSGPGGLGISNDHILYSYPIDAAGNSSWPYKNTVANIAGITLVLNLMNGAVSFFTNLFVTTSFKTKPMTSSSELTTIIVSRCINGLNAGAAGGAYTTTGSGLLNGNKIFTDSSTGADNFDALLGYATFGTPQRLGPDVMFETTKLSMGDASRLKFWKRFLLNYSSEVSMTAAFIGTNATTLDFPNISLGSVSSDVLAASSNTGILHRLRFLIRSSTLSIRVYQTSATSATSQRFKCFWWSVGGKRMRQGRPNP